MTSLTVLNVAYPLAPVGRDAAGGAEQVLHQLDAGLSRAGHHSLVIACVGSEAAGMLLETPAPPAMIDGVACEAAHLACRHRIAEALARWPVDVIHFHGIDFDRYLPSPGVSTLVTLHLPPDWYRPAALGPARPQTYFNCVSMAQQSACPPGMALLQTIPNGVPEAGAPISQVKRRFVFMLGRICPEKGFHIGLDAARRAGMPLLLAGTVFGYDRHQRYFCQDIVPRLDRARRFLGPIGFRRKHRLLAAAQCLLVPSLVPETSSLVAMEALACGTPVIAFPAGALPDIVEDGRTGFLVRDAQEMGEAIAATAQLSPENCREAARRRFSAGAMVERYLALYEALARGDGADVMWADVKRGLSSDLKPCRYSAAFLPP